MINVLIKTESHYTVSRDRIRATVARILHDKGVKSNAEVSINIVGDRLMRNLNNKYRHVDESTDVLSFPLENGSDMSFVDVPDNVLRLGDIIISYPQARDEAGQENKMIDDKLDELVEHGLMHLLGTHHD